MYFPVITIPLKPLRKLLKFGMMRDYDVYKFLFVLICAIFPHLLPLNLEIVLGLHSHNYLSE